MVTHNIERRATLDNKRRESRPTEPARREDIRKANGHEAQVASGEQTTPERANKRKRTDNADQYPRKNVQAESEDAAARVEQPPTELLKVVAENIGTHRIVRGMTKEHITWTERILGIKHGRRGLLELDRQFRQMDRDVKSSDEEKEAIRSQCAKRLDQMEIAQAYVDSLATPMRDMIAKHAVRNNRIYQFIDISEGHAELSFLPSEFWTAYKTYSMAYTACKGIESQMYDVENEQFDVLRRLDERMVSSVPHDNHGDTPTNEPDAAQYAPFGESTEIQEARIRKLGGASLRLDRLREPLESARDKQYEEESKLNQIVEEAFVAAGYLHAVDDSEEIELLRRVPITDEVDEKNTERRSGSAGSVEQDYGSSARSPDRSILADRVRRARKNVGYREKRLRDARWQPLSDAGSMDSDARGVLRVRRWIRRTGELREAEHEYRSILHRAQNEHAMSDKSSQSSNFRDHISDGYGASTIRAYGCPTAEKRKDRIHNWMSPSSLQRRKQQVKQAAEASDEEGNWVDRVNSMKFGEDPEGRDVARWRERIDRWETERDRLRKDGPFENGENDFHPQNIGTATDVVEVGQQERDSALDFGEDDNANIQQRSNDPRTLYNPDALTADLVDSDRGAAQWIEKHFNGRWKMQHTAEDERS